MLPAHVAWEIYSQCLLGVQEVAVAQFDSVAESAKTTPAESLSAKPRSRNTINKALGWTQGPYLMPKSWYPGGASIP